MVSEKRSYDLAEVRAQIYWDLPADIGPIRQLLENYSGIRPEDVDAHILAIVSTRFRIENTRKNFQSPATGDMVCLATHYWLSYPRVADKAGVGYHR